MIRILWRGISEPIQYSKSFCGLHLSLASLVGELQAKAFPISEVENSGSIYSSPLSPLSSTIKTPRRGIWTYLMWEILLQPPIVHSSFGYGATTQKVHSF